MGGCVASAANRCRVRKCESVNMQNDQSKTGELAAVASSDLCHFAARLFAAPVAGQIGPQDRPHVVYAKSLAAAKRAAKVLAQTNSWRLVEVFPLAPSERDEFRQAGWYVNTLRA